MDVQVLVTHADHVATMDREMGHPPRIIRGPALCDLFHARAMSLVDPLEAYGIAAQVVQIVPDAEPSSGPEPAGRDPNPRVGPIRETGPRLGLPI